MINKKKYAAISAVLLIILCSGAIVYNKDKANADGKNNISNESIVPESINDIPPGIIDNIAPDIEQDFKAEAKDFESHDENGNEVRLSHYKGQYIVLNFWNSTCEACTSELPLFEKVIKKYEGQVIFLNVYITDGNNETKESVIKYLKDNNLEIKTVFDDHYDVRVNYKITTLPRTVFIDKNGLIQKDIKSVLNEETLEEQIQNLINSGN